MGAPLGFDSAAAVSDDIDEASDGEGGGEGSDWAMKRMCLLHVSQSPIHLKVNIHGAFQVVASFRTVFEALTHHFGYSGPNLFLGHQRISSGDSQCRTLTMPCLTCSFSTTTPSTFLGPRSGSGCLDGDLIGESCVCSSLSSSGAALTDVSGDGFPWSTAVLSGEVSTGNLGNRTVVSSSSSSCCPLAAAGVDVDLPKDVVELRSMLAREKIGRGSVSSC